MSGLIRTAKNILQDVVLSCAPNATIVRSAAEESHAIMARKWPLVALIKNPGKFDDREAKTVRYADEEAGTIKERTVRGSRILPVLIRCWAEGEDAADELFSSIIPHLPRKFEYDGFSGLVLINAEEHSDHTGNTNKLFLSVSEVQFTVPVATEETVVPTIKIVESEPEV